jgi:hypothetical protein
VLASGEPGYDITNNIYKIGDGTSNWNNLKSVLDITGNATISGILSASSGNFNNLLVSGIPVSVSGHAHVSADIADFNSSVSGLLPKIANSGDNRILTSTGSSLGIDAESNLTFSDDILSIVPTGFFGSTIHMYTVPNGQSAIHFISPSGSPFLDPLTRRLSIVYDEEDEQCRIVSHEDFTIQVFDRITLDSQTSGVFVTTAINNGLYVNGVQVSVSGHAHTSSNITDFNSSVSGLLPVIANSGDNRILTSTGSTVGVNAESNLTFDGNLLSVSGNLVAVSGTYNQLIFNTSLPDPDLSQGQLQWNSSEGTLDLGFTDTYSQHMGEELHYRVRNNTASTLTKGTAVYASGLTPGSNNRIEVAPFTADGSVREVRFMGLVTENISNGVNGYTTQFGYIRGIDTRGDAASNGYSGKLWDAGEPSWSEGDILYAHPTVAGKLTKVEPKHSISVAIILNRHQNQGKVFVRPTSYGHLNDNHDVAISGATNGQFLQYNSDTDYWVPSSSGNFSTLSVNGSGVSLNGHSHTSNDITDFNSSVSGLLPITSILGGTNISIVPSGSIFTVNVSGSLGLTTEEVDDRISNLLVAGSGISLDYNDGSDTLTINNISISPDEIEEYIATSGFPASGDLNTVYIATDTAQIFKWDGEVYYEAGPQGASTGSHATQHTSDSSDPIPLKEYSVPTLTANTNNLAHNNKDILYLDSDANNRELSGLIAPNFCVAKMLVNLSSTNTIILKFQSTNSDPSNRFIVYTGSDYYLLPGYSISVLYDTNAARWRVL